MNLLKPKNILKNTLPPSNMKKYYESHKEEIKQRVKEYKQKTNYDSNLPAEKKKEYNRTAKDIEENTNYNKID